MTPTKTTAAVRRSDRSVAARRQGFTIVETIVALTIFGTALTFTAQWLAATAMVRREAGRRQTAAAEASNVLERLSAERWEALPPGESERPLSDAAARELPDGSVRVSIVEESQPLPARRISIEVGWRGRDGGFPQRVRLATWRYRDAMGEIP